MKNKLLDKIIELGVHNGVSNGVKKNTYTYFIRKRKENSLKYL